MWSTAAYADDARPEEAMNHPTNADIIHVYSAISQDVIEVFGDQGDLICRYLLMVVVC
jgi:hypothetical protein